MLFVVGMVALVAACSGDSSGEVTIQNIMNESGSGGSFTATGSAICDAGEMHTQDFDISETLWWYEDRYTCADGSGAFVLRGELPGFDTEAEVVDPEPADGTWTILDGSGDYLNLEGSGTSHVDFVPAWIESYVGEMSNG
jgi:hypothetical protein